MRQQKSGRVRVISGTAGGLFLKVPRKFPSRPTQDKVKQAVFSSMMPRIFDSHILDLYSGVGSLGIEALSRGAATCVMVEKDHVALGSIKENLQHCHLTEQAEVIASDVLKFLSAKIVLPQPADLIFLDPPYIKGKNDLATWAICEHMPRWLKEEGLIVWEHDKMNVWSDHPMLELQRTANYGNSSVSYLIKKIPSVVD
ncbi:MAG: 16S rRNA (guanine(966)-N(2))-methyltransferase RsmD [Verrucomicrobiota bacterium]